MMQCRGMMDEVRAAQLAHEALASDHDEAGAELLSLLDERASRPTDDAPDEDLDARIQCATERIRAKNTRLRDHADQIHSLISEWVGAGGTWADIDEYVSPASPRKRKRDLPKRVWSACVGR